MESRDDALGVGIAAALQVGVSQVVHRMQLFADVTLIVRGVAGGFVGLDRIFPEAEAGEDVGRHMQGMRRCRCDLRVRSGRRQSALSELRAVVGVDQVMGHTRMVGLTVVDGLEDVSGPFLVGVGVIGGRSGCNQRQGVKDLGFVVAREVLGDGLHGALVCLGPGRVVSWVRVAEVNGCGTDKLALASGTCANPLRGLHLGAAELELGYSGGLPQLVEPRHRNTPVGDRAAGIL